MSLPVEHRLAAIMFTDIVGYTALMRRDERAAMDMLHKNRQGHQACILGYGGTYLKEMGDGTLASFPTATAALQCATSLLRTVEEHQIRLRIGIHIGEVIFEGKDVFGDGVNIASRLEAMAEPGTILASEALYQTVKSKSGVQAKYIDEVTFKGFTEPTKVYKLNMNADVIPVATDSAQSQRQSVAVLPFTNMSPDPDQVYFSDGLSEELINALSRLNQLHVCARTSAFQFRGQAIDVRDIGRQLNVGSIVAGSVRRSGNRLRITAQLIDASNGYHLWSERFDREMDDIFEIQDEISLAIVDNLKVRLLGDDKVRLLNRYTNNQEVYHQYLRANYFINRRTVPDFNRAIGYYQEVIRMEPSYALAYSGMALAYTLLARYGGMPPREAFAHVRSYAQQALAIDPELHEGYTGIALYEGRFAWRWSQAEMAFLTAIEMNPNHAVTHHQFGWFLASTGRVQQGLAELEIARSLDPLSLIIRTNIGTLLYFAEDFGAAEAVLLKVLSHEPDFVVAHQWLGRCYEVTSRYAEALEHHRRSLALLGDDPESVASYGHAQALDGDSSGAYKALKELERLRSEKFVSNYWVALVYKGLGEADKCMDHLSIAIEECFDWMTFLRVDPMWKSLHDHARFKDILQAVEQGAAHPGTERSESTP